MKRSRYAHQVTACSLYHLLTDSLASDFEEFSSEKGNVPQLTFWFITLSLQLLLFTFVRSLHEENFQLLVYRNSLQDGSLVFLPQTK